MQIYLPLYEKYEYNNVVNAFGRTNPQKKCLLIQFFVFIANVGVIQRRSNQSELSHKYVQQSQHVQTYDDCDHRIKLEYCGYFCANSIGNVFPYSGQMSVGIVNSFLYKYSFCMTFKGQYL